LYDATWDKHVYGEAQNNCRTTIRKLIKHAPQEVLDRRLKGKHRDSENGKDVRLYRFEGEVFECGEWKEPTPCPKDPREGPPNYRIRTEFIELKYEVSFFTCVCWNGFLNFFDLTV
jgi:hypothetical protein